MTTDNTHTTISGPAVDFDTAALRSWLAEPTRNDTDRASELGIDEFFGRGHGHLLSGLRDLLAALSDKQSVWRLRPGIEHVGFFRTFDGETSDGAIIVVDLANGLRLAGPHQDHRGFASRDSRGIEAAIEALGSLALQANTIVTEYQAKAGGSDQPTDGQLTDRELCIYGLTEVQYRNLETAMGLPRYALGRYKEWSAPNGVYLGLGYNLDAAIHFARRTGLRYSETREIQHNPTTGKRPSADSEPA